MADRWRRGAGLTVRGAGSCVSRIGGFARCAMRSTGSGVRRPIAKPSTACGTPPRQLSLHAPSVGSFLCACRLACHSLVACALRRGCQLYMTIEREAATQDLARQHRRLAWRGGLTGRRVRRRQRPAQRARRDRPPARPRHASPRQARRGLGQTQDGRRGRPRARTCRAAALSETPRV
jgi:hypothetical protein